PWFPMSAIRSYVDHMRDGCRRERLARALHHPHIVDEHGRILAGRSRRDHDDGIVRTEFLGKPVCGPGGEKIGLGMPQRQYRHTLGRQQPRARPSDEALSTQYDHASWRPHIRSEVLEHEVLRDRLLEAWLGN